jgi:hypothetical protein
LAYTDVRLEELKIPATISAVTTTVTNSEDLAYIVYLVKECVYFINFVVPKDEYILCKRGLQNNYSMKQLKQLQFFHIK